MVDETARIRLCYVKGSNENIEV